MRARKAVQAALLAVALVVLGIAPAHAASSPLERVSTTVLPGICDLLPLCEAQPQDPAPPAPEPEEPVGNGVCSDVPGDPDCPVEPVEPVANGECSTVPGDPDCTVEPAPDPEPVANGVCTTVPGDPDCPPPAEPPAEPVTPPVVPVTPSTPTPSTSAPAPAPAAPSATATATPSPTTPEQRRAATRALVSASSPTEAAAAIASLGVVPVGSTMGTTVARSEVVDLCIVVSDDRTTPESVDLGTYAVDDLQSAGLEVGGAVVECGSAAERVVLAQASTTLRTAPRDAPSSSGPPTLAVLLGVLLLGGLLVVAGARMWGGMRAQRH